MKQYIFGLFLLVSFGIKAQDRCTELVQTQLVDKVKHLKSTDLLPYYDETSKKWGFFDKNSGEKVTEGVLDYPDFFNPHLRVRTTYYEKIRNRKVERYCLGYVKGSNFGYQNSVIEVGSFCGGLGYKDRLKAEIKPNINGFEVDEKGKLTYVSPKYYNEDNGYTDFYEIFKFKEKYYAITFDREDGNHHIIDEQGNIARKIKSGERGTYLKTIYSNSKDVWVQKDGKFEGIFTGKVIKDIAPVITIQYKNIGYQVVETNNGNGLLDLTTMKWKIKPNPKNNFDIEYTSSEELENVDEMMVIPYKLVKENRKKIKIYLLDYKNKILKDLNGKIYLPK